MTITWFVQSQKQIHVSDLNGRGHALLNPNIAVQSSIFHVADAYAIISFIHWIAGRTLEDEIEVIDHGFLGNVGLPVSVSPIVSLVTAGINSVWLDGTIGAGGTTPVHLACCEILNRS